MSDELGTSVYSVRVNGKPIFLHPFHDRDYCLSLRPKQVIHGHYGNELNHKILPFFRDELEKKLERHLKAWNEERSFIRSFLSASVAFLLCFVFLSIGIRDPIPLIDELLLALCAGVVVFIWVTRRMFRSTDLESRRLFILHIFDSIAFLPNPLLEQVQEIIDEYEQIIEEENKEKILFLLTKQEEEQKFTAIQQLADDMLYLLDMYFSHRQFRTFKKTPARLLSFLSREWFQVKQLQLPLYLFYIQLKMFNK